MRFFDVRYRLHRTAAILVFFAVLAILWAGAAGQLSREATELLARSGAHRWLSENMAAAARDPIPTLTRLRVLSDYLRLGVVPAVKAVARKGHRGYIFLFGSPLVALLVAWAVFTRAADWSDRRRDRPAVGRWASWQEVTSKFRPFPGEPSVYFGLYRPQGIAGRLLHPGGARELKMPMRHLVENVVVVGGIGAGKSWGLLIPMIASAAREPQLSVIAVDIKFGESDCLTTAARFWMESGGKVVVWNPWDPNSIRVDILEGLTADSEDIWEHVAILMGHAPNQVSDQVVFWSTSEAVVMEVLLRSALMEGRHMDRVRELSYLTPEALQQYIAAVDRPDMRRKLDRFFGLAYDKQAGSLYGLEKYLRDWDNPTVIRATTPGPPGESFELRRLLREHVMFVIGIPQAKFVSGQSLVLFRLLLKTLTKMLLSARQPGENQKVILVLEEFAQLERIPYFEQFLSSCRSRGVATVVTMQDVHRGYAVYGRDLFTGLLNNMRTVVLFPESLGAEEARYFSELIGYRPAESRSWSAGGPDRRVSLGERAQPLVPAEEMRWGWKKQEVLVATSGIPPFRAWCPPAITIKPFRRELLRLAPAEAVVPRAGGGIDVIPPSMEELSRHYRMSVAAEVIREWARSHDHRSRAAWSAASAAGGGPPWSPGEMAVEGEDGAGFWGEAAASLGAGTVAQGGVSAESTQRASVAPSVPTSPAPDGAVAGSYGSVSPGLGEATTVQDLVIPVLESLVERIERDPAIVAAVEVKFSRDRKSFDVVVPRRLLEELFGSSLGKRLLAWMEMGWLEPVRGDRFRLTRGACQVASAQLRETLLRRLVLARKDRQVSPSDRGGKVAVSPEASRKFVVLCQWVARNLSMFDGHPSFRSDQEPAGVYVEGTAVGVLPYRIHMVTGGDHESNWSVWREWVDAGWCDAEKKRLTRLVQVGGERKRVVWIFWDAYLAASRGEVPEVRRGVAVQGLLENVTVG